MQIRIKDVVANTQVVDGDALLTPLVMARIVTAVMASIKATTEDDKARQRDTHIGGADKCCHGQDKGQP